MARYVFDIETDGLLPELTKIHSLVLKDIDTGEVISCCNEGGHWPILLGLGHLAEADLIVGHNIIEFDLPAIQKVHPDWTTRAVVRDTVVCTRLIWPSDLLTSIDHANRRGNGGQIIPGDLIGRHSLEAWGYRLTEYKGDFKGPWEEWSSAMQDYCEQDVEVTYKLWKLVESKNYSERAIQLEHDVQEIIARQVIAGAPFDVEAARRLYAQLVQRRLEITKELQRAFPAWEVRTTFTPKANNKKRGYVKGVPTEKVRVVEFNPASGDHIADRLMKLRGWKPEAYGKDGKPTVDESTLAALPYPEIPLLLTYTMIQKRIGQLAEGKKALLKMVEKDGRIHGGVVTNGTVTGRAAHRSPNLGQIPKVKKHKTEGILKGEKGEYGWEFRSLFYAPVGWKMVGVDVSGLELRNLGHYLARWDGGAYAREVVEGDVHTLTMQALGIESRDTAKTFIYALLYGAGDEKLGKILGAKKNRAKAGRAARAKFLGALSALKYLTDACRQKHRTQKFVKGLDGRILHTRSDHSALNTLIQAAGAVICKMWLVCAQKRFDARGWIEGKDYQGILWVHDERQWLVRPEIADDFAKEAVAAIRDAEKEFSIRCPLDGEAKVGNTWAETH